MDEINSFPSTAAYNIKLSAICFATYDVTFVFPSIQLMVVRCTCMTILLLIDCTFQLLKDRQLLLMIGGLFVIDCAIVIVWITVDSLQRKVIKFAYEVGAHQYDTIFFTLIHRNRSKFGPASSPAFNNRQHVPFLFGIFLRTNFLH